MDRNQIAAMAAEVRFCSHPIDIKQIIARSFINVVVAMNGHMDQMQFAIDCGLVTPERNAA